MSQVLCYVDPNVSVSPKKAYLRKPHYDLPMPSRRPASRKQRALQLFQSYEGRQQTFNDFQRHLYELLISTKPVSPSDFRQTLVRLIHNLDNEAAADIAPLTEGVDWNSGPLAYTVIAINRYKRVKICQGYEYHLQDFCDWLLLAYKLQENVSTEQIADFSQHLGPLTRVWVEECVRESNGDLLALLTRVNQHLEFQKANKKTFPQRYAAVVLDDLIEIDCRIPPMDIFAQQTEIKQTTRAMAAEWLFRCLKTTQSVRNTETFFLCMSVLDRYIAQVTIPIRQFLLAACASALLASKCEETCGIYPNTLVRNTQNSFSANDLLEAEKRIALQLDMKVQVCSSYQVASALLSEQDPPPSQKQRIIVYYILTLVTTFTHFGEYPQRYLAAAAVHISRVVCNVRSCPPSAEVAQVLPVVLNCVRQGYHGAKIGGLLYDMFAADSYQCVSTIPYESYF